MPVGGDLGLLTITLCNNALHKAILQPLVTQTDLNRLNIEQNRIIARLFRSILES